MRNETITIYKYDELPEDAQEKVLNNLYDLNVDYEWWDFIYEDAERIGLRITSFDLDHGNITGVLTEYMEHSIELILENHGPTCDTFKLATEYQKYYDQIQDKMGRAISESRIIELEDELKSLTEEYKHALLQDILVMLRKEYEYLVSREAVEETIRANEYEFTEDGNLY